MSVSRRAWSPGRDIPETWGNPEVNRAVDTLRQIEHPFATIQNPSNLPIQWRLLFPLVWHLLSLPIVAFFAMPFIGCLATLWGVVSIVMQRTGDLWLAWWCAVAFAATPWFFVSTGWLTYFDSWLMLGLLAIAYAPRCWGVVAITLTPWVDERVLFALPMCLAIRAADAPGLSEKRRGIARSELFVMIAAAATYVVVRGVVATAVKQEISSGYLREYITWSRLGAVSATRWLEGAWSGLRFAWVLTVAAIVLAYRRRDTRRWVLAQAIAAVAALAACCLLAADLSRGFVIVAPLAIVGVVELWRTWPHTARWALPAMATLNLLTPASHVVTVFTIPIHSLPVEIRALAVPPPLFDPAYHAKQGDALLHQGKFADAEKSFTMTLQLDPRRKDALLGRAIARTELGELALAIIDAREALTKLDPASSDAKRCQALIARLTTTTTTRPAATSPADSPTTMPVQ